MRASQPWLYFPQHPCTFQLDSFHQRTMREAQCLPYACANLFATSVCVCARARVCVCVCVRMCVCVGREVGGGGGAHQRLLAQTHADREAKIRMGLPPISSESFKARFSRLRSTSNCVRASTSLARRACSRHTRGSGCGQYVPQLHCSQRLAF